MTVRFCSVLFILIAYGFTACQPPAPAAPPTVAQQADSIAKVFETPEVYSVLTLDSASVLGFITEHPEYTSDSSAIFSFYQRRAFQSAWFVGDSLSSAAGNFLHLVAATDTAGSAQAAEVGQWLNELNGLLEQADSSGLIESLRTRTELSLTAQFFRIANARYGGFVSRDLRELDWYIPRHKKNFGMLLDSLVAGVNDLGPIEPLHPQYRALKDALKRYHDLDTARWTALDATLCKRWTIGRTDSSILGLRHRLFLLGDMAVDTGGIVIDSALVEGVKRAQERFGFKASGKPDAALLSELDVLPAERVRTILVNMERLRWVPSRQDSDLILVNIPEYRMHVYEHDTLAWSMDVVVGATATRTVVFSGQLSQVVMAPYWNVPSSIIAKEVLPAVKKDPRYLDRKGMEVVKGDKVVAGSSIDWSKYRSGVPFTIRQKPGPGNALGQVKFLFPNEYSIYLHDTPAKDKFTRDRRAFSHGCIRLSEPAKLAQYLLSGDSTWTPASVRAAMSGTTEVRVRLSRTRPVILGYFTAWVDTHGLLCFRHDVYGHDERLAGELFASPLEEPVAEAAPR